MSRNAPFFGEITRRLHAGWGPALALLTAVQAAGEAGPAATNATNAPPARVVILHDPSATVLFAPQSERVRTMVSRGLTHLTSQATEAAAWRSLVSPEDVVGLKVCSAPGSTCGTRPAVVGAVIEGLLQAGIPAGNIIVWDKQMTDLRAAGFDTLVRRYGVGLASSAAAGYDEKIFYANPFLGSLMWGDSEFGQAGEVVGRNSYLSRLVTGRLTRIINLSPLLNNNLAGVAGNLYSLAFGSVDNTRRFESDSTRMAIAVPDIYNLPSLGEHVVLNLVDALLCQYEGGRRGMLHYSATLNQLRFSRDPVALDVLSIQELDRQRQLTGVPREKPNLELYQNATLIELGTSDPTRIKLEQVECGGR